jgi:hypothetical protein
MELTHENIMDFMKRYFVAYSTLAQNPETNHRMNEYFAPDFEVTLYVYAPPTAAINREKFLLMSASHPGIQETITPEHIIVDDKQHMAAVLLTGEFTVENTGEIIRQTFSAHYQLGLDEEKNIKLKSLRLFGQSTAPSERNIFDLYHEAYKRSRKGLQR